MTSAGLKEQSPGFFKAMALCSCLAACGPTQKPRYQTEPAPAVDPCRKETRQGYGLAAEASWTQVKEIIVENCVSCHPGFDGFEKAKGWGEKLVKRVELGEQDTGFMPKDGKKLALADRKALILWDAAGFPKDNVGFGAEASPPSNEDDATSEGNSNGTGANESNKSPGANCR